MENNHDNKNKLQFGGLWKRSGVGGDFLSGSITLKQLAQLYMDATATGKMEFWLNMNQNKFKTEGSKQPDFRLSLTPRDISYPHTHEPTSAHMPSENMGDNGDDSPF